MKKLLISVFILLSFLFSLIYAEGVTKNQKLEKAYEIFNNRLTSPDHEVRLKAADEIAQLGYDTLRKFEIHYTRCGKLWNKNYDTFKKECTYMNHGIYHLLNVYGTYAKREMDPKSKIFCKNNNPGCVSPFLSKIRWLVFDQFGNPFYPTDGLPSKSGDVSGMELKEIAYSMLDSITHLKINDQNDLKPFKPLTASNDELQWFFKELNTSGPMYPAPVFYYILADKAGKITYQQRLMPFVKSDYGYDYNPNRLCTIQNIYDIAIYPGTTIGILRAQLEAGAVVYYFIDLKNRFTPLGSLYFSYCEKIWTGKLSTIDTVKKVLKNKSSFPLKPKTGTIRVDGETVEYGVKNEI